MPDGCGGATGGSDGGGAASGISEAEAAPAIKKFVEDSAKLRQEHGDKF